MVPLFEAGYRYKFSRDLYLKCGKQDRSNIRALDGVRVEYTPDSPWGIADNGDRIIMVCREWCTKEIGANNT